jgi:nicotinamide mononucleotide transporter
VLSTVLNAPIVTVGGYSLRAGEAFGFATGIPCVALAARGSILNFPVGIISSAALALLFADARLFGASALQAGFVVLGGAGWWRWRRGDGGEGAAPTWMGRRAVARSALATVVLVAGLVPALAWANGSLPVFDATIAALSVVAQVHLNARRVESWGFWIAVNVVSAPVYAAKGLWLVAALYLVLLAIACRGASRWARMAERGERAAA